MFFFVFWSCKRASPVMSVARFFFCRPRRLLSLPTQHNARSSLQSWVHIVCMYRLRVRTYVLSRSRTHGPGLFFFFFFQRIYTSAVSSTEEWLIPMEDHIIPNIGLIQQYSVFLLKMSCMYILKLSAVSCDFTWVRQIAWSILSFFACKLLDFFLYVVCTYHIGMIHIFNTQV